MKIGDEIFVHGYVDEIRKDTVIVRNNGGYFGADESEIYQRDGLRARAHWINEIQSTADGMHLYQQNRCSKCEHVYITTTNFCPHCGSIMSRGEQNE